MDLFRHCPYLPSGLFRDEGYYCHTYLEKWKDTPQTFVDVQKGMFRYSKAIWENDVYFRCSTRIATATSEIIPVTAGRGEGFAEVAGITGDEVAGCAVPVVWFAGCVVTGDVPDLSRS